MPRATPQVWRAFEKNLKEDLAFKFEIEDISEGMWSTAVEFMLGNYIREDVWWSNTGAANDPMAVQEYRALLTSIVQQKMSLACFLTEEDGSGRSLVAVNMCMQQKRGHFVEHRPCLLYNVCQKLQPKSKAGLLSLRMFSEAMKVTAIYDKFGTNEYMMGAGLSVTPEYRGIGIAVEMLNARIELAKELGFKVTGGIFTSHEAQRSAVKAGMECCYQISYKDFGKQCDIKFNTKTEYLKIYGISTA